MDTLPKTVDGVVNNLDFDDSKGIEYVDDIGSEEKDGLGISATLNFKGEDITVLGSVVIEDDEPVIEDRGTSFVAYPDGLIEDAVVLLEGEAAVEAAIKLYDMRKFDEEPFNQPYK